MLLFPHEKRIVGCQLIQDHRDFISVLFLQQMCHEIRKAGIAHLADGWRQAAGDQLALVGQINSIVGLDKSHHTLKVRVRNQHGGKGIPCVTSVCLNTHGLANVRNPKPA